jgi:hypothetical protein
MKRFVFMALIGTVLSLSVSSALGAEVDFTTLRQKASRYAEATYINAHSFGKHHRLHRRHFHLFEQDSYTVKANDGSLLTAFQAHDSKAKPKIWLHTGKNPEPQGTAANAPDGSRTRDLRFERTRVGRIRSRLRL